jgi:hypothetical protein
MVNQLQKSQIISDLAWVIKVTKSAKSKEQLSISLKCFFLWEQKYKVVLEKFSKTKIHMRGSFWAIYKNKESEFSLFSTSL